MKREPGHVVEDGVGGEQRHTDVNRGCCDPQIVGVDRLVEGTPALAARMTKLSDSGQEGVTHRDDGGRGDRLLEPLSALISPASDEGAVAQLGDGDGGEEDLVAGHETNLGFEAGASASADRRAEDAGVDENSHDSSAAAKASSSSSESSSISNASIELSTGAASS